MKKIRVLAVILILTIVNLSYLSGSLGDFHVRQVENVTPQSQTILVEEYMNYDSISNPPQQLNADWTMFRHDSAHSGNSTSKVPVNNTIFWSAVGSESSSASITNGLVFCGSSNYLECYYESNGSLNWRNNIGNAGAGVVASPAVADNKVYIGSSNDMYCFWINNGSQVWTYPVGPHYTSPAVSNGKVYFGSSSGDLYSLLANDGSLVWNVAIGDTHSSPAVANGKVFVGSSSGPANINCLYASDGTTFWQYNIGGQIHSSPAVVNGSVYVGSTNGQLYCLDEDGFTDGNDGWTGESNTGSGYGDVIWSYSIGGQLWSSPAVANGKVFIASTNGRMYCLWASNSTHIWDTNLDSEIYSSPSVADGKVLINNMSGHLNCLYESNGTINWTFDTGIGSMYSSSSIANDRVYVNSFGGFYCLGLPDTTLPRIQSVNPMQDAINMALDTNVTILFNESMDRSSTENAFSITPNVAGSFYWVDSATLLFDPANPLAGDTTYTIIITADAKDESNNPLDGNENGIPDIPSTLDDYSWNFTTRESVMPIILATKPEKNAENISLNTDIRVEFSESMNHTSVEQVFGISPTTSGSFSWDNNNFSFTPDSALLPETLYTVTINSTATDLIGNLLDGDKDGMPEGSPDDDYSWSFTTIEIIPPQIVSVSPADKAEDVLINVDIQVVFNELMNFTAVETAFSITPNVTGFMIWTGGESFTFTPETNFEPATEYILKITTLATDIVGNSLDGNGNGIAEGSPTDDYLWSFNTSSIKDDIPPIVVATVPQNDAVDVNVSTEIKFIFSEAMNQALTEIGFSIIPNTGGALSWDTNGMELSFALSSALDYDTQYLIIIRGNSARDLAGNTLDGNNNSVPEGSPTDDFQLSFTTESEPILDPIPPKIESTLPLDKAADVNVTDIIEVTFSEEMDKVATQFAFLIWPSVTGTFDWGNSKMIYYPNTDLAYDTSYTVTIQSSATDLVGNLLDGNNNDFSEGSPFDDYVWEFTTVQESVTGQYDIVISGVTEINIKLGENKTYPIGITNKGTQEDTLAPSLDAGILNSYISLDSTASRALQPDGSWNVNLILDIPTTVETKSYNITVSATSQNGHFTVDHVIKVNILPFDKDDGDSDSSTDKTYESLFIFGIIIVIVIIIVVVLIAIFILKRRSRDDYYAPQGPPQPVTGTTVPPPPSPAPAIPYDQPPYGASYPATPPPPMATPLTAQPVSVSPALPPPVPVQVAWDDEQEE